MGCVVGMGQDTAIDMRLLRISQKPGNHAMNTSQTPVLRRA